MAKISVYQIVTDRIIDQMQKGIIPWMKPWTGDDRPFNAVSKKNYSLLNSLLLIGRSNPQWATFNQISKLGGKVKKGTKSSVVCFWKMLEKEEDGVKKTIPILRYYRVFNIDDTEGLPEKFYAVEDAKDNPRIDTAEEIVKRNNPTIKDDTKAFYSPSFDYIGMPKIETFISSEHYYSTLFHEMTHWTGHESRCNRKQGMANAFGSEKYAKEELVAEIGSSFLCHMTGIANKAIEDNEIAYIQSWMKRLRDDNKLIVYASSQAEKAVKYMTGTEADNT